MKNILNPTGKIEISAMLKNIYSHQFMQFNLNFCIVALLVLSGCKEQTSEFDASGTFESIEVIVSAEATGKILDFKPVVGDLLNETDTIVIIDPINLPFQKAQVESSIASLKDKQIDPNPQTAILKEQLKAQGIKLEAADIQMAYLQKEKKRIEDLIIADAAVPKQLDDIIHQINQLDKNRSAQIQQMSVTKQQIKSNHASVRNQNRSISSAEEPLLKQVALLEDQISRSNIVNPVSGTLLTKYAVKGEFVTIGKALYKVADLKDMQLRAYITGDQLSQIKLGQQVDVFIDESKDNYRTYTGTISWISDKAEFTPKTIQTKQERSNLVYAIKVDVSNDGYIKIGMYGELKFKEIEN